MLILREMLFWLAAVNLAVVVLMAWQLIWGGRQLRHLQDIQPDPSDELPRVSVLVAARNEAANIEAGVRSLLGLDYPDLELVVVNDRSTDRTGEILRLLREECPQLQIVELTELPNGWLGKNHAHHLAAQQATGSFLLFTDADVVMHPSTLRRAIAYAQNQQLDHLAIAPEAQVPGWILQCFVAVFTMFFSAWMRPWSARNPRSSAYIGIGAFNLVRRSAYQAAGGHQPIAMRPDDDIKLGKLLKSHGFRQDILVGADLVCVPWYESLGQLIRGLEKNTFAVVEYRVLLVLLNNLILLALDFWPFPALLLTRGATWWLNAAVAALLLTLCAIAAVGHRFKPWVALGFPLVVLLFIYIQIRATFLTIRNRGIQWRETHYSLEQLRANRI